MFSQTARYGLRATLFIAMEGKEKPVKVNYISKELGIPMAYLHKIVRKLVNEGILISGRGPKGGLSLKRDPDKISTLDVIKGADPGFSGQGCFFGFPSCNEKSPCPYHDEWGNLMDQVCGLLKQKTLDRVLNKLEIIHLIDTQKFNNLIMEKQ